MVGKSLAKLHLAGPLVHDRTAVSMAVRAHPRITDARRRRGPRVVMVVVLIMAMVLAHGYVFLVIIVLARGLRAETHLGWLGVMEVSSSRSRRVGHVGL
ncbi:hypothetical protein HD806DRAFT_135155 [Xylariaceae sp. AK1471]|nr:hypothetical protein HD806DRAFT_135155 [Xylariaceae sp. AK1471]